VFFEAQGLDHVSKVGQVVGVDVHDIVGIVGFLVNHTNFNLHVLEHGDDPDLVLEVALQETDLLRGF